MTKDDLNTKNIFLIMPDDMVKKYRRRFLQEGFICKAVDSGFYALTMLEREKPSLIIATEDIEDLEIYDLLEIIDSDPDLSSTHIIVLSDDLEPHTNRRCMALSRESQFEDVLSTAYQLLNIRVDEVSDTIPIANSDTASLFHNTDDTKLTNDIILEDTSVDENSSISANTDDTATVDTIENQYEGAGFGAKNIDEKYDSQVGVYQSADLRYDTNDAQITGELASDQLVELIKTFAMGSRGLLIVRTSKKDGRLLLEHDRLLKAEYDNSEGQEAFNALLYNVLSEDRVSYFFKRYDNTSSTNAGRGKGVALSYLLKVSGEFVKS